MGPPTGRLPTRRVEEERTVRRADALHDVLREGPSAGALESGRTNLRTEQDRAPYADALEAAVAARRAQIVQVAGNKVHADDGVHLSGAGYEVLIPRLADAANSPT